MDYRGMKRKKKRRRSESQGQDVRREGGARGVKKGQKRGRVT